MRRPAALLVGVVALAVLAGACSGDESSTADADRLRTALLDQTTTSSRPTTTDEPARSTTRTRASTTSRADKTLADFGEAAGAVAAATTTTRPTTTLAPTTLPATTVAVEPATTVAPVAPAAAPAAPPAVVPGEPMVEIPAIGLIRPLFEGIELDTLDLGPGHWPGTAVPGQPGNVVVAGHRVSHNADFRHLDRLVPGDEVAFTTHDGRFTYRVVRTEIVPPEAMWVIDQGAGHTATLLACHPPGSIRERIVVHLELS